MKRASIFLALGLVLGSVLATWTGPTLIGWWFQPPVNIGIDCRQAIEWSMGKLILLQMVGMVLGSVVGIVVDLLIRKRKST